MASLETLEMYPRTTLSDIRHYEGQARAKRGLRQRACHRRWSGHNVRLPASYGVGARQFFWDGRPPVFGSVAHGGCPSDTCVLCAIPRLTVGTDCCRARRHLMRGCRQGLPASPSENQRCSARRLHTLSSLSTAQTAPLKRNQHAEEAIFSQKKMSPVLPCVFAGSSLSQLPNGCGGSSDDRNCTGVQGQRKSTIGTKFSVSHCPFLMRCGF